MDRSRLPSGGRIDRGRPLNFTFDGREMSGFAGDTLASALLANGVRIVGRSFKLHRPRGVLSAGLEEPNALVTVGEGAGRQVSLRATEVVLREGLVAASQNAWPSIRFDLGGALGGISRLLPAGFYHKTFMWPRWSWYEPAIRHAAGLGRIGQEADTVRHSSCFHHCDVLIVGGGYAGLEAARREGRAGAQVVLVEADVELGGSLLWSNENSADARWRDDALRELSAMANVRLLPGTVAFGHYEDNLVAAIEMPEESKGDCQRLWKIRADRIVLATGAIERPLVFTNNDLPGVMLASAVRVYANRYAVLAGRRIVIATNNDSAYRTAFDLHRLGTRVHCVVDARADVTGELITRAQGDGIEVLRGYSIVRAHGRSVLRSVEVAQLNASGQDFVRGTARPFDCDALAVSGGWSPTVHLYSQAGGTLRYDAAKACLVPDACPQAVECVGAANGDFEGAYSGNVKPHWRAPGHAKHRQWVDFLHDVTVSDIELSAREGFTSVEHLKRYTATGMAVDQGKTGNVNALALLGESTGREIAEVGTTTFRPPYHPVTIGTLAGTRVGNLGQRYRRLPVRWHENNGGVMEDHSGWLRAAYYPRDGEDEAAAIRREVGAARNRAALFDSSSLGKIEVIGKDAAEFLDRIYINNVRTLKPGRLRYGMMLNENGVIMDDGVFACLEPDHYLVCPSSAGTRDVHFWMEEWRQCEWRDLDVRLVNQSAQWATLTVSGPQSRAIVAQLDTGVDFAPEVFAHMHIREGAWQDDPLRIRRASFTGEMSYELDIAADRAEELWTRLLEIGAPYGITPLGMEALDVLRVEKGFLEVGVDTDGETTPLDVGWAAAIAKKPGDFLGRRSLKRPAQQRCDRLQLVGLKPKQPDLSVPVGVHAFDGSGALLGPVSSACVSPTLGRGIAMARLRGGAGMPDGHEVMLDIDGRRHPARVCERAFHDPKGERLVGASLGTIPSAEISADRRIVGVSTASKETVGASTAAKEIVGAPSGAIGVAERRAKWLLVGKPESLAAIHPLAPNTSADVGGFGRILWLRPDQWLVLDSSSLQRRGPGSSPPTGVATLPATGRYVEITLDGPTARDVLAVGCSLDLRDASFPVQACAGTRIETVPVTLLRESEYRYTVLVERPLSNYLIRWLEQAATGLPTGAKE